MSSQLTLRVYTDPFCPYAYSAEPSRLRLLWLYGEQVTWEHRVIVLSGYNNETSAITPEKSAQFKSMLSEKYGMPMVTDIADRQQVTALACTAYVGVREHNSTRADTFLRNLRIAALSNKTLDEQTGLITIAEKSGIDSQDLTSWMGADTTKNALTADAEAARNPGELAMAFRHKLSQTSDGRTRYSAPSYQILKEGSIVFELPGYLPLEAYEAALGNLAPALVRRDDPSSVVDVLSWADTPLATVEVAAIMQQPIAKTKNELEQSKAKFEPVGTDDFWSL